MLYRNTIIPIDAHDDTVRFIFLGGYFGHKDVVVKSAKTGNVEALVTNAESAVVKDSVFPYPVVEIDRLPEGAYNIYSTDHNHTEASYSASVTLSGENTYQQMQTCSKLAHADAEKLLEHFKSDMPYGLESILYLRNQYVAEVDSEKKIALAKLVMKAVSLVNERMQGGQLLRESDYFVADEMLLLEMDCDHVLRKDIVTNEIQQCTPFSKYGETNMPEEDDHLYLYTEIDKEGVPIGFLLSFRPDPIVYGVLKEDMIYRRNLAENAVEKAGSMSLGGIEFEAYDKPILSVLNELWPDGPYMHAPRITFSSGEAVVEFGEEDKKILSLFPESYYLAVNPPDFALDPGQRIRMQIPGRDFATYAYKLQIGSEDYVCWIEDEAGNIVSDIKALCMNKDGLSGLSTNKDRTDSLNSKIRSLYFEKYKKHLLPLAKAIDEECVAAMQDALSYCDAAESYPQDIAHAVIEQRMGRGISPLVRKIIPIVMKDKIAYGSYATNFFNSKPVYKSESHVLAMPPESGLLYKIERYSYDDGRQVQFFRSNAHEAIDCRFYDCDFAVVTAIDTKSGKSSGFLLFDFENTPQEKTRITKFLVDVKEVEA